jgi:hypothetical protein
MGGWVGGWGGGWMEVKAVLRIAYSNKKSKDTMMTNIIISFVFFMYNAMTTTP